MNQFEQFIIYIMFLSLYSLILQLLKSYYKKWRSQEHLRLFSLMKVRKTFAILKMKKLFLLLLLIKFFKY